MNLDRYHPFESDHVPARNVEVWLPPDYKSTTDTRYPVIYMHDGQNLFEPENSYIGVDWGIDEALNGLIGREEVPPPIIVSIWNASNRLGEYMPQAALSTEKARDEMKAFVEKRWPDTKYTPNGDQYLKLIVEELKPFIDSRYPTRPDRAHTHLMGASLGGLISLYGLCRYPEVFGGAGCLSNAWNFGKGILLPYFEHALPSPNHHKIYLDMGGQESHYPPFNEDLINKHQEFIQYATNAGYQEGKNLLAMIFSEDEHSELAWRRRVHIPLRFLLANTSQTS